MTEPDAAPSPVQAVSGGNVTRLVRGEREIFVVGTAHVSQHSVREVQKLIEDLHPDTVCVELDTARYETLTDETRWRRLVLEDIVKSGRAGLFLSSLLFSAFQKQLGDRVGVKPGAEMLAAIEAARAIGAEVVFADREIQSTLTRCYASLGPLDRMKVIAALGTLPFAAADIDEAQIEQLKQREAIGDAMDAFARQMPTLKVPLIDERDQYLMASTRDAPGKRIVSVVGAAHVAGMCAKLDTPVDREALTAVPVAATKARLAAFILPLLAWTVVTLAFALPSPHPIAQVLFALFLPVALTSAVTTVAAGATVPAVVTALVLAPAALFAPSHWFGQLTASVQASTRKPTPDHAARIREDVLSPARFRNNPFLVGLLVGPAARFGRTLGAIMGLVWAALRLH